MHTATYVNASYNMLALCLMLSVAHYAQNYTGIIGLGLIETHHASWTHSNVTHRVMKPAYKIRYNIIETKIKFTLIQ